jgi:hypothetical protein
MHAVTEYTNIPGMFSVIITIHISVINARNFGSYVCDQPLGGWKDQSEYLDPRAHQFNENIST